MKRGLSSRGVASVSGRIEADHKAFSGQRLLPACVIATAQWSRDTRNFHLGAISQGHGNFGDTRPEGLTWLPGSVGFFPVTPKSKIALDRLACVLKPDLFFCDYSIHNELLIPIPGLPFWVRRLVFVRGRARIAVRVDEQSAIILRCGSHDPGGRVMTQ